MAHVKKDFIFHLICERYLQIVIVENLCNCLIFFFHIREA